MGKTKNTRFIGIASIVGWVIACFALLAWQYSDYMYKVEELSMFIGTSTYMHQCMVLPGGLLTWSSTWLTSLLINQYTGAGIISAILLLLQIISIRAFKLPVSWWPISIVIPLLPLLSFLRLGYDIFVIKPLGFAFALPLGLIFCVAIYWGYRKIRDWRFRSIAILIIAIIGYPYFGFYALLAVLMCACNNNYQSIKVKNWNKMVPMIIALMTIVSLPQLYFLYVESNLMGSQIYLSPLPRFFSSEISQWGLYLIIFIIMLTAAIISTHWSNISLKVSFSVWSIVLIGLFTLRCSDPNLMHTLAMERALNNQEWNKATRMANEINFEPTRLNTVLGYIAHLREGTLGDQLFKSKYGWAPYNTTRGGDPMHDAGGSIISYHLGLVNYAYRWATEYMVEQGMGAERMKMMIKCALLNYEIDLAKYYLDILYNIPNQRAWAKKYMKYVSNPIEMNTDQELASIRQLMCQPNIFINDGGSIEGYIWPQLASASNGSPEFVELSIYSALILRDLESAMAKIPSYVERYGKPSKTMQEAALFWAKSNQTPCPIEIEPYVESQYENFTNAFRNTSYMSPEDQRDFLRESYSNTLWFYLVFTEDNPIK